MIVFLIKVFFFSFLMPMVLTVLFLAFDKVIEQNKIHTFGRKKFKGKTAVITGGGAGIGKETVLFFAKNQWKVYVLDLNEDALADLEGIAKKKDYDITTIQVDVSNFEDLLEAVNKIDSKSVEALVNCAGITFACPTLGATFDEAELQMRVNLHAPIHLSRWLLDKLLDGEDGSCIVNVSSTAGDNGYSFQGLYSATKFGLDGFSHSLRIESQKSDLPLRVALVKPGPVSTQMLNSGLDRQKEWTANNSDTPFHEGIKSNERKAKDFMEILGSPEAVNEYMVIEPIVVAETIYAAVCDPNSRPIYYCYTFWFMLFQIAQRYLPLSVSDSMM